MPNEKVPDARPIRVGYGKTLRRGTLACRHLQPFPGPIVDDRPL